MPKSRSRKQQERSEDKAFGLLSESDKVDVKDNARFATSNPFIISSVGRGELRTQTKKLAGARGAFTIAPGGDVLNARRGEGKKFLKRRSKK